MIVLLTHIHLNILLGIYLYVDEIIINLASSYVVELPVPIINEYYADSDMYVRALAQQLLCSADGRNESGDSESLEGHLHRMN